MFELIMETQRDFLLGLKFRRSLSVEQQTNLNVCVYSVLQTGCMMYIRGRYQCINSTKTNLQKIIK